MQKASKTKVGDMTKLKADEWSQRAKKEVLRGSSSDTYKVKKKK